MNTTNTQTLKILFASSEIFPLIKTGGLADVAQSLPIALQQLGHDIRLVLPAYRQVKEKLPPATNKIKLSVVDHEIEIIESTLPNTSIILWAIDCPSLFDRDGNPYINNQGEPWDDNAQRFALLCRTIVDISLNKAQLEWQPDILHCNDWHTGLASALLHSEKNRPKTIFTIHNLAYQGLFSRETFESLHLDEKFWSYDRLEFNNQLSFIKAGIVYADQVTTVSPTYAKEIQTPEYGAGLHELLKYHSSKLSGIINGINELEWNPAIDKNIYCNYSSENFALKKVNKEKLQQELKLPIDKDIPLFSVISRIAEQKGIDLIASILSDLAQMNTQIVLLGSGDKNLEQVLSSIARQHPKHVAVRIGYDEALAHKITAAADFFLMPSRYEPCGLNQMYSQHYGTIPIVRSTGGLADTVGNYNESPTTSSGIVFHGDGHVDLYNAIKIALDIYQQKNTLHQLQLNGMNQDFSWINSAKQYLEIYHNN